MFDVDWLTATDLWAARWLFTRALAAIAAIAFLNVLLQWRPLLGTRGLLPAPRHLAATDFRSQPSLFHLSYSDRLVDLVGGLGLALSLALVVGLPQRGPVWAPLVAWLAVWALYLSIVNAGQIWYGFGWESILLEAMFFAAFLGSDRVAPPRVGVLLVLWLLFRVEVGAGLIKLRGDRVWRDLTALEYHHETQPLPGPLSWHAHHLPRWWHRTEVAGNYAAQLVAPFGLFAPQPVASIVAAVIVVTQSWLVLTGNFAWLNVLTIVLAVPALSGDWLQWLPVDPPALTDAPTWFTVLVLGVGAAVVVASWWPVRNMLSSRQRMNAQYNPLHLVGSYGAFGSITRQRDEFVIEGTAEPGAGAGADWREYEFKGKPGDPGRRPPLIAPYHLRLDWLMWFAPLSSAYARSWLPELLRRLLRADPQVLGLLRHDPFDGAPPDAVRVVRYRYRYTTPAERRETGDWWVRRRLGEEVPPVTWADRG